MNVIDRAGPYVEQLLHNDAARTDLRRAVGSARQAYGGAKAKKNPKKVLGDRKVRGRTTQSVTALRDSVLAVRTGREEAQRKTRRRHRRRSLAMLLLTAGGLYLAADESARGRLTKRLRDPGAGSAASDASDTTSAEGTP
jgi:hypothetical protein